MQSAKETASNMAASAKAGMEKTKATVQEKGERMSTRHPLQKEMATEKKERRIHDAERQKHEAREHNAATRHAGGTFGHDYTSTGTGTTGVDPTIIGSETGTTGAEPMAGSEYPAGHATGTGRSGARTGYGGGNIQ